MGTHVFGIRHHGPGCARALRDALATLGPDLVLVEGPPDANETLQYVADAGLVPPVALLVHAVDDPSHASLYPFAEFSPEWQALSHAVKRGVPARFMDLPCAHTLALTARAESADSEAEPGADDEPAGAALREDPIGVLAEAAGYADYEQWWDVQVEQRRDASGLFEAILEAMTALRDAHVETRADELRREAHMRGAIRAAVKEGFQRIAVVCGAWHAPALVRLGPAKPDQELLKALPKRKVAATWIPWTYSRLCFRSGYGAGVDSPGWYGQLWRHGARAPVVWATLAARLLRDHDLDASAASVIETVRLAEAAAALRELPGPGLLELREAIEAVLCGGASTRLGLIRARLEVGDMLGEVPEHAGQAPLMRALELELKRLRLKLSTEQYALELDLRKELDRDRSRLVHRLRVLGVEWGKPLAGNKGAGTFKEGWQLAWHPEFAVDIVAANIHGNTLELAAGRALAERARAAALGELAQLVEVATLAHLPLALEALLRELDVRAASSSDVCAQLEALGPLARLVRYGDVRETRAELVSPVLRALFERATVGLLPACTQLDDDAAAAMIEAFAQAHAACLLLEDAELKADWLAALHALLDAAAVHPRLSGKACRLLLEQGALAEGELARRASLALSGSLDPARVARWIEGLVAGEGLLLVHQEELLSMLDGWLAALADDNFQAQLPLLRRAFSGLAGPERRAIAQRMKRTLSARPERRVEAAGFDQAVVVQLLPVLAHVLGVPHG